MADELPGGWLPPKPPQPPQPQPQRPVFVTERPQRPPANGLTIAALVCSIASLALLALSLGISFFFSLVLGIAGWVCAARSGQSGGGRTLAIVAVVLSVVAALVWLALFVAGFTPEELQRELEDYLERQRQSS
jgi:predicted PurR-regulated permease PerM